MKKPVAEPKPTPPPAGPQSFFDLSFSGHLPQLLRAIADQIDAGDVSAEQFDWSLTKKHLQFSARIDMKPEGSL